MSKELEETNEPTVQYFYPEQWTDDMYYCNFKMPAGQFNLQDLQLDLGDNTIVNLVWSLHRSADDQTNYLVDEYHRTNRDDEQPSFPQPLTRFCHKLSDIGVTTFQFPATWGLNIHVLGPLKTKPCIIYRH